jgi:hypothetical protein
MCGGSSSLDVARDDLNLVEGVSGIAVTTINRETYAVN